MCCYFVFCFHWNINLAGWKYCRHLHLQDPRVSDWCHQSYRPKSTLFRWLVEDLPKKPTSSLSFYTYNEDISVIIMNEVSFSPWESTLDYVVSKPVSKGAVFRPSCRSMSSAKIIWNVYSTGLFTRKSDSNIVPDKKRWTLFI